MANKVIYHPKYFNRLAAAALRYSREIQQLRDDIKYERDQIREERHALRAELDAAWSELRRLQQIDRIQRTERDVEGVLQCIERYNKPAPVGNLGPEILVMQSAQNWHRQRATGSLDGTWDRCVLVQR